MGKREATEQWAGPSLSSRGGVSRKGQGEQEGAGRPSFRLELPTSASPVSSFLPRQVTYMSAVTLEREGTPLVLTIEPSDLECMKYIRKILSGKIVLMNTWDI